MAMLPVLVGDEAVGVLGLQAREAGYFDEEEVALLSELAGDIAFALQNIEKQEQLDYLSYYDPLTGLPNRTLFIDRAGQQMRARGGEPRMVALILLNIERFRYINESFGRHGGDSLLKLVAQRLEAAFHGKDYLARVGADGFGVVIRGIRDAEAAVHAVENQVLGCFREAYQLDGNELRVSAKAGIAMFPVDGADADTLFKNAEAALKKARDSGERHLFYAADMNARAAHVLSLETRLRKAVEARQFVLHYQPKIELANDRICGLEALIRWQEPGGELVPPGAFIPLLEETGLILEVGKWALGQALMDHREWTARGCKVPRIAVNVSAIQLQQKDFSDMVINVVQEQGSGPDALELEVTESLLMKDVEGSIRKLSLLRGLGIHVAMDDFGTGYSSLSYIARLPINLVKIDRSFINGMANSPQDMAIVTTIIALAHSLNLRVVAEGVETESQSKLLKLLKCDEAQGFLFSKPLPGAQIEPLLRTLA
jgi:diguanylate cyclase (GGDEF)-like protein